jgi:hypothetical protein
MADIIELEIVGKVTNLKPMLATVSRLEREIVKSTKALDQNKMSQTRYNKVLTSARAEYRGLGVSAQKAYREVGKLSTATKLASAAQTKEIALNKQYAAARREATAANARHTAETTRSNAVSAQAIATEERLKNKFVQGYAAMDIYTKELNDLSMARKANIISTVQQSAAVERLNMQMVKGTGAFAGYRGGVVQAGRSTNQLGVVAQQTGYQVGDFLVQIQSGANPMMAFGQQATQLVGVLPLLSAQLGISAGRLMGIAAGLGIAIPLVTAIAGFMLRSGKATKSLSESLDDAVSSLDEYISMMEKAGDMGADGFSEVRESIIGTSEAYKSLILLAKLQASSDLTSGLTAVSEAASDSAAELLGISKTFNNNRALFSSIFGGEDAIAQFEVFKDGLETVSDFQQSLNDLRNEDSLSGQYQAALAIKEQFLEIVPLNEDMSKEAKVFFTALNQSIFQMELLGAATKAVGDQLDAHVTARQAYLDLIDEVTGSQADELALVTAINVYGKDHYEVAKLRAKQEGISKGLLGKELALYISMEMVIREIVTGTEDVVTAAEDISPALQNAIDQANVFADAMSRAKTASQGIGISTAGINAQIAALEGGSSKAEATARGAATTLRESLTSDLGGNIGGIEGIGIDNQVEDRYQQVLARERAQEALSALNRTPSTTTNKTPNSGSNTSDTPDFVEALEAEMVVRGELVKLYGDEYELQSEIARIVKGLGEDSGDYNAQSIAALAQQNILLKEQEALRDESAAQMENIYNMLGDEMGTAFTSMIDGTKSVEDAFKSMAKNIIDQLIQIFIVEQMVNSISGGLGSLFGGGGGSSMQGLTPNPHTASGFNANGNVFSGGSQVQAYANGGIVNSPTMFPMNGNKTGLMGEDGPEAIMPLKRGANGKLGVQAEGSGKGGDNVVIHQNFNFQANGDDSVKKIIQQAAPQIAQMTKSSMLNDRRRGGQTKSVFG